MILKNKDDIDNFLQRKKVRLTALFNIENIIIYLLRWITYTLLLQELTINV